MDMRTVLASSALVLLAFAQIAPAQAPPTQTPPRRDEVPPLFDRLDETPKSKSDAYRLVGKVLDIDRTRGAVKLATEEGERTVHPTPQLLAAIRVGDTISVPREQDPPVNASPSTAPRRR